MYASPPPLTVLGIWKKPAGDHFPKVVHICVLDAVGEITEESQITTNPKAYRARFEGLALTRIAIEVGGHSAWISELLKELGHEVLVTNARKLRMIFQKEHQPQSWKMRPTNCCVEHERSKGISHWRPTDL